MTAQPLVRRMLITCAAALVTTGAFWALIPHHAHGLLVSDGKLYWVKDPLPDGRFGTIGRANADGTGVRPGFIRGVAARLGESGDGGLASSATHLYWAVSSVGGDSKNSGRIGRARLNGTGVDHSLITRIQPGSLDVHGNHVYWTNYIDYSPRQPGASIGRARLNGRGVNRRFVRSGESAASGAGIAIDSSGIYWGGGRRGGIGAALSGDAHPIARANLNGGSMRRSFLDVPGSPFDLENSLLFYTQDSGLTPSGPYTEVRYTDLADQSGQVSGNRLMEVRLGRTTFAVGASHLYWTEVARSGTRIMRAPLVDEQTSGEDGPPVTYKRLGPRQQVVFVRHRTSQTVY